VKPWSERDKAVVWHPFTPQQEWCAGEPLVIVRGEGAFLIDDHGRRYLDGVGSLWCNVHGHNHPRINAAIAAQLEAIAHTTFLGLSHPPGIGLAERLVGLTGLDRVFFSDSGSSAVEIALKLAFQYGRLRGRGDRRHFLHLSQSYHGDTLGAVGVGGIEIFHRVFGAIVVPGIAVPTPYASPTDRPSPAAQLERALAALDRVLDQHHQSVAAFVVEPLIQGAAGMLTHPPGYLRAVAERCRSLEIPLIVDEVATGFGRTGTLFACEQEGVTPDFLCLAKGLTGGYLPLAATLTTHAVYDAFLGERRDLKHFFHGHTFTANPLACAAALASLDLLTTAADDRVGGTREPGGTRVADDRVGGTRVADDRADDRVGGTRGSDDRVGGTREPDDRVGGTREPDDRADDRVGGTREPDDRVGGTREPDDRSGRTEALAGEPSSPLPRQGRGVVDAGPARMRPELAGLGARLQKALERHVMGRKGVIDVRRVGAMVGIELGPFAWDHFVGVQVCERMREHGVILRPLGDVLVWMPPLNLTDDELEILGSATGRAIEEMVPRGTDGAR
jgi:adenosylmethionine-8-amino-7-oxononanoate aminotransferase